MQDAHPGTGQASGRRRWLPVAAVLVLFYAVAASIVFSGAVPNGRAASDQLNYHEPVIHTFADQWPTPDLSNYYSATTPLYHWLLAGVEVAVHPGRRGLMLAGSVFTAGLLGLLAGSLRTGPARATVLMLPVLCSMYVLFPGIWLLPDNAGWLGVVAVLLLALRREMRRWNLLWAGLLLVVLVLVRQIHLWAAALVWAGSWLGPIEAKDAPEGHAPPPLMPIVRVGELFEGLSGRVRRLVPAVIATAPAFGAVAYFFWLWHGPVVPRYQEGSHGGYSGWNPATAAFHLAIIGSFGPFYIGWCWEGLGRLVRRPGLLVGVVLVAVLLAVVPATTYAPEVGRKSGLWNLVKAGPVLGGHTSVVLLVLAPVGAVTVASFLCQLRARDGWLFLVAFVAFVAAQTVSPQLWQRYHEPFILMMLALMSGASKPEPRSRAARAWRWIGPTTLAAGFGALSGWTIMSDDAAVPLPTGDFQRAVEYEPLR